MAFLNILTLHSGVVPNLHAYHLFVGVHLFFNNLLIHASSDHPMAVVRDIDQQTAEVHLG
jgi:hypothetical protein